MKTLIAVAAGVTLAASAAHAQTQETTSPEVVREVQVSLAARGFGPGPADGQLSAKTMEALRALQRTRGLAPTGRVDAATLTVLGINPTPVATALAPTAALAPSALPGSNAVPSLAPSAGMPGTGVPGTLPPGTNFLGGTPAGAPSPSFGATPAGAASGAFAPTPAGAPSPVFGAPQPGASLTAVAPTAVPTLAPGASIPRSGANGAPTGARR